LSRIVDLSPAAPDRGRSNAELVDKAIRLAPLLDRSPADPDEARALLGLRCANVS
jgi:uncharacterized protein (DUF849 family)